jgi:hypothetical protein
MYLMTSVEYWQGEFYTEDPTLLIAEVSDTLVADLRDLSQRVAGTPLKIATILTYPEYTKVFGGDAGEIVLGTDIWATVDRLPNDLGSLPTIGINEMYVSFDPKRQQVFIHAVTDDGEIIDGSAIDIKDME